MPSLAALTDAAAPPQQDNSLPVEQPYLGVPAGPDGVRRVYINTSEAPVSNTQLPSVGNGVLEQPFSAGNATVNKIIYRLTGSNGEERYQTWPEKVVREALAAPHDAMTGEIPQYAVDPDTGAVHTSPQIIAGAQAVSALAGSGGLAGAGDVAAGDAALGSTPFLRPALKYGDKIYKAPVNGQHLDALPAHLAEDFQTKALSGQDINDYNFGFMNHKGQFLDREKALDYAIKEGLVDPSAGQYGALTSTLLADSSKPGTAIEAMAKSRLLSKEDMIKRGADGHLNRAYEKLIPIDKIDGLEPTPAASEGNPYVKGKPITQPIEVAYDKVSDNYMLYAGNHRVTQANLNGDKYIKAFVQPDGKDIGVHARDALPKFDFAPGESSGSRSVKLGPTEITYGVNPKNNDVELSLIKTDKDERGKGSAKTAILQFLNEADASNKRVLLNADPMDKSTSKEKLETFYKSLGFVRNSGNKRDFSTRAEYIREPAKPKYVFKPVDYNPFEKNNK